MQYQGGEKRGLDLLELLLHKAVSYPYVLGTLSRFSARAASSVFNC